MYLNTFHLKLTSIFFLWFLVIFGPVLDVGLGPFSDVSFFSSLLISISWFWNPVNRFYGYLFALLISISALATFTAIAFDTNAIPVGVRAILRPIRTLIVLLAVVLLSKFTIRFVSDRHPDEKELDLYVRCLALIYSTVVLHGLVMLLQFLYPDLREFIYGFTMAKYQLDFYQNFRMAGLSGAGGAQVSFVQGLGFCLGVFLWKKVRFKTIVLISNVILLASVLLSGRSGLVPAFFAIIFVFFILLFNVVYTGRFVARNFSGKIITALVLLFFSATFGFQYVLENKYFVIALERTFATLISYQETGEISDNTLIALSEMFVLPSDIFHILFGTASYLENNTYYNFNTDIGYFRLIWGYGIVGLFLHITFYFMLISGAIQFGRKENFLSIVNVFLLSMVLLFNSKEIFFFSKMSFQICLASFALAHYSLGTARYKLTK